MKTVFTPAAPRPSGHYSQAILHQGTVYVSGQLPIDPKTGERKLGSIQEQTEQVLRNLEGILQAAGSSLDRVLKVTIYVSDISAWDQVNQVYARFFGNHRPARAIVPTRELHYGFQIEVEAVAAASPSSAA